MTRAALDVLRTNLPDIFDFNRVRTDWDLDWMVIPISKIEQGELAEFEVEAAMQLGSDFDFHSELPRMDTLGLASGIAQPLIYASGEPIPGAPLPPAPGSPPPPDALAFYLPYHYHAPDSWGIYLTFEGVKQLTDRLLADTFGAVSPDDAWHLARVFLYAHEAYHHAVETFATRWELDRREPLYRTGFERLFRRQIRSEESLEEALATGYALQKADYAARRGGMTTEARAAAHGALMKYVESCPPSYAAGVRYYPRPEFTAGQGRFAEMNHEECFGGPTLPAAVWRNAPHAFRGAENVTSRVNYIVHRDDPIFMREDLGLRFFSRRGVVERLVRPAGLEFVREGGKHEIWKVRSGARVTIPRHGRLANGTIRAILKEAGLAISLKESLAS